MRIGRLSHGFWAVASLFLLWQSQALAQFPTEESSAAWQSQPTPLGLETEAEDKKPQALPQPISRTDMTAILRISEKTTARFIEVSIPLGEVYRYKQLRIYPKRCWLSNQQNAPEQAVLLGVYEGDTGESPVRLFAGWMFAQNSSLTSLEHAYYDVTLLRCVPRTEETQESTKGE